MRLFSTATVLGIFVGLGTGNAFSQDNVKTDTEEIVDPTKVKKEKAFTIKPVLLDTDKSEGSSLALDYTYNKKFQFWKPGKTSVGSEVIGDIDPDY
jgi:hypothetical protein